MKYLRCVALLRADNIWEIKPIFLEVGNIPLKIQFIHGELGYFTGLTLSGFLKYKEISSEPIRMIKSGIFLNVIGNCKTIYILPALILIKIEVKMTDKNEIKWREEFEKLVIEKNEGRFPQISLARHPDPQYSHEYLDGEVWFAFEYYLHARRKAQEEIDSLTASYKYRISEFASRSHVSSPLFTGVALEIADMEEKQRMNIKNHEIEKLEAENEKLNHGLGLTLNALQRESEEKEKLKGLVGEAALLVKYATNCNTKTVVTALGFGYIHEDGCEKCLWIKKAKEVLGDD